MLCSLPVRLDGKSVRRAGIGGLTDLARRVRDAKTRGQRIHSTDKTVYLATLAPEDNRIRVDMPQAFDRTIMSHELVHLIQNRAGSSNYVDPDEGAGTDE